MKGGVFVVVQCPPAESLKRCFTFRSSVNSYRFTAFQVVFTTAKRAQTYQSEKPVHSLVNKDPIEIGSQVFIDILLLAKCGHFLHSESSVSALASYFNPDMKQFSVGHLDDDTVRF